MALVIDSPAIENQLKQEASRNGVSVENIALDILAGHLTSTAQPNELSAAARIALLDKFIASNSGRKVLQKEAFEREGFYSDDPL